MTYVLKCPNSSHQRSWWIVHTQPTETADRLGFPQIPPTQLVDCSYSTYRNSWQARLPPNPTNAVGGLFILNLQKQLAGSASPKSHQRSWWIVHTQPTETAGRLGFPQIPPTQLVDCSYSTYRNSWQARLPPNPTNAVGGIWNETMSKLQTPH